MPGRRGSWAETLYLLIREPVFKGVFRALTTEYRRPSRPDDLVDESIGSFLSRRLGSPLIADNIASAVFHGVYAGDIYQLSARSLLQTAWEIEGRYGSLYKGYFAQLRGEAATPALEEDLALMKQKSPISMAGQSVYTFIGGIEDLTNSIVAALENNPNIEIRKETRVENLTLEQDKLDLKVCLTIVLNFQQLLYFHF